MHPRILAQKEDAARQKLSLGLAHLYKSLGVKPEEGSTRFEKEPHVRRVLELESIAAQVEALSEKATEARKALKSVAEMKKTEEALAVAAERVSQLEAENADLRQRLSVGSATTAGTLEQAQAEEAQGEAPDVVGTPGQGESQKAQEGAPDAAGVIVEEVPNPVLSEKAKG